MSGHSKWSTIKRKKGAADAKRGQLFTKLIKEITVTARLGGGNPDANPRLRRAIEDARAQSMPSDNIERAIKKGTGELEGMNYEEVMYEGYGPGGVAILVQSLTDNKNRTVAELRNLFARKGGNLGESGCVAWMFHPKGVISFDKAVVSENRLMEVALDAGADDIIDSDDTWDVMTAPQNYDSVKKALTEAGFKAVAAELSMVAESTMKIADTETEGKALNLMEALDDHDDVQKIYSNLGSY